MHVDVIVIGAGAAGLMCAATAGGRGRSVLLIDHYPKLAEKIRISGGGRCNFTNRDLRPDCFQRDEIARRVARQRRAISSRWSNGTASATTRRRWASCSATTVHSRSSTC